MLKLSPWNKRQSFEPNDIRAWWGRTKDNPTRQPNCILHMSCGSYQFLRAKPHGSMTLGQLQILPEPKGEHQMLALSSRCGKWQSRRWRFFCCFFLFGGLWLWPVLAVHRTSDISSINMAGRPRDVVASAGRQQERCQSYCLWLLVAGMSFVFKWCRS